MGFEPRFTCKSKELSSLVGIPNLGVLVADTVEITPPKKRATSIHFQTGQAGDLALFSIKSKDTNKSACFGNTDEAGMFNRKMVVFIGQISIVSPVIPPLIAEVVLMSPCKLRLFATYESI